jgi:imidazolonepropionase-like amidohydrolase
MGAIKIIGATIFDGEKISEKKSITFENGVIVENTEGAAEVNAEGCTLLPALIDSHVHLYKIDNLKMAAQYGVGTMFDMASRSPQVSNRLRNIDGLPHILSACCPAFAPNSKMTDSMAYPDSTHVAGVSDAGRFVDEQISGGADYIKIILEDPKIPGQVGFPEEILKAIVAKAHANGKKVVSHSVSSAHFELCANLGIDVITHIPFFKALPSETIDLLSEKKTAIVPTMGVMKGIVSKIKKKNPFLPFSYKHVKKSVEMLHAAGLLMLAGTDSNMYDPTTPCEMPYGSSLHEELILMTEAGFSPIEALQSATGLPAKFWGLNDKGGLEVGRKADLFLVGGNPAKDIKVIHNIRQVWLEGKEVYHSSR